MKRSALALLALPLLAAAPSAKPPTAAEILAAAPASDWQIADPQDVVVMEVAGGKRVTFLLAGDIAPAHAANIRGLVRAHWFDGGTVYRVQENYVVQWGQGEDKTVPAEFAKPLPAEYDRPAAELPFVPSPYGDTYAPKVGYHAAFPIAQKDGRAWLAHCYGTVAVARGMTDTGSGGDLYAVIGEARGLDRNITTVGRMIDGFDAIATLPRGTGELGFYEKPEQRFAITRLMLAADLPPAERPAYRWLRPESRSFAQWLHARAMRQDEFFAVPAGAVDLCRGSPPVRPIK